MQKALRDAVRLAGLAQRPHGKRFRHQQRIPGAVLTRSANRLVRSIKHIERCESFHALFRIVRRAIGGIPGIGELTVYDTALRIGAKLDLHPDRVYLHAGTRAGAKALRLDHGADWLSLDALPVAMRKLSPQQVEDILCIYKMDLERITRAAV